MRENIIAYVSPASDAEAFTHQCNKRRKMIGHQITSVLARAKSLSPNDPAQDGIQRTLDRLEDALLAVGTVRL